MNGAECRFVTAGLGMGRFGQVRCVHDIMLCMDYDQDFEIRTDIQLAKKCILIKRLHTFDYISTESE